MKKEIQMARPIRKTKRMYEEYWGFGLWILSSITAVLYILNYAGIDIN